MIVASRFGEILGGPRHQKIGRANSERVAQALAQQPAIEHQGRGGGHVSSWRVTPIERKPMLCLEQALRVAKSGRGSARASLLL